MIGGHSHRRVTSLYVAIAAAGAGVAVVAVLLVWRLEAFHARCGWVFAAAVARGSGIR